MLPTLSRAVLLAACFAAAAGQIFNLQCSPASAGTCGGKCCAVMWTLGGTDGSYTCSKAGETTCGLCGQDGLPECAVTVANYPELLDESGDPVGLATPTPPASGFGFGGIIGSGATGSSVPPTAPGNGVTLYPGTYNSMPGWIDIPDSTFSGFTEFLLGIAATVPSFYTNGGFNVQYSCGKGRNDPDSLIACSLFFFVYSCPPCESTDGGVPALLMASTEPEWYAGSCGPVFKLSDHVEAAEHQFAVWQAETPINTVVRVTLEGPAELMFWALVGKDVVCASKLTESACNTVPDNCEWLDADTVCRPKGCPTGSPFMGAAFPRCQTCVSDEEEFLPIVNI